MSNPLQRLYRLLLAQQCWYLVSGFFMILGCYLMSQDPRAEESALIYGVALQGLVLAYTGLVVGLAILVRRRLHVINDSYNLACVALVLLLDPTFFSTRFWAHSTWAGLSVNSALLVASALLLGLLVTVGRFPIDLRSLLTWGFTLAVVYGAGATMEPGATARNLEALTMLSFVPLAVALISRWWHGDDALSKGQEEVPSDLPDLWGQRGTIYRTYLKAVVMYYPFLVLVRHMDGLAATFAVDWSAAHLAPAVLGLAVLVVKTCPRALERTRLVHAMGALSILMAASGAPPSAARDGFLIGLLPVMVSLNTLLGIAYYHLRRARDFPTYPVLCSMVLVTTRTDGGVGGLLSGLADMQSAPLTVLAAAAALHALLDRGFWEVLGAWMAALLLVLELSPLHGEGALAVGLHGAGLLYLASVHLYPRKDLYPTCPAVALVLLAMLWAASGAPGKTGALATPLFVLEAVGFLLLGLATEVQGYLVPALCLSGARIGMHFSSVITAVDLRWLLERWTGPLAVAAAFVTLGLGLLGTLARGVEVKGGK